jgi:acyl carrier protein
MMDRTALLQALQEMLEEDRGEKYEGLEESVSLREGLGLDSVDLVTLVMQVQDRFRVVLTSDELEHVLTIKDLLDLMQSKLVQVTTRQAA